MMFDLTPGVRSIGSLALGCTAFFSAVSPVESAVIAGNLSGDDNASASPQSTFWLGQAFATDDTPYTVDSITIQGGNSPAGSEVHLYSDSGSLPSVELGSFSTTGFGTASGTHTLPAESSMTLEPSTTYWIVFAPNDVNFGLWARTTSTESLNGPGAMPDLQAFSNDGGSSFSSTDISNNLKMEVQGTVVPEPGIVSLALCGGLALVRRHRHPIRR